MTSDIDYAAEIARINTQVEQALAKYTEDVQDQRFGQHTAKLLELFDGWIERAEEINALRAVRLDRRRRPADRTEEVAAFEPRLIRLRGLL